MSYTLTAVGGAVCHIGRRCAEWSFAGLWHAPCSVEDVGGEPYTPAPSETKNINNTYNYLDHEH